jgi:hypothetical protein
MSKQSQISIRPKNLELSLFTLWSLFILIDQHYKALVRFRKVLDQDYDLKKENEIDLETIYEALVYQILLKSCSFIEEWDKIFGVTTEKEYEKDVRKIKSIAKPARKFIDSWKGLREFRNQAIAHNHRDNKGNNIYFIKKTFHMPNGLGELALLIYCIEKMSKVAGAVLYDEWKRSITKPFQTGFEYDYSKYKFLNREDIHIIIDRVDHEIEILFKEKYPDVINVTSDYGDFLRVAP